MREFEAFSIADSDRGLAYGSLCLNPLKSEKRLAIWVGTSHWSTDSCPQIYELDRMFCRACTWVFTSSIVCTILLSIHPVQAQEWQYSRDPNDYDFGWIANGTLSNGSVPLDTYCINANTEGDPTGPITYLNRKVDLYRCDGVQVNEKWAYHGQTSAIVFNNLTGMALCVDSKYGTNLTLQECNSSLPTQRWKWDGGHTLVMETGGRSLRLIGGLPSPQNSFSDEYTYNLTLSSSAPVDDGTETIAFSFLPQNTLVNYSTSRFTTKGLLALNGGELQNGDFETSTIQTGLRIAASDWVMKVPSYLSMGGWVIETGPIDYVAGALPSEDGQKSIHLNTHTDQAHAGAISQTIETKERDHYRLSFYMTGFPPNFNIPPEVRPDWSCGSSYSEAQLQVEISDMSGKLDKSLQNFSVNVEGRSSSEPWLPRLVDFWPSTNTTKILFRSLNFNSSCGPMLDSVSVWRPAPKNHTLAWGLGGGIGGAVLLLAVIVGVVAFKVRRRHAKAREEYAELLKNEFAKVYSQKQLSAATNKFSSVIGEGGFGTVYKAVFPDGTTRAVKVEKRKNINSSPEAAAQASEEISLLLRVHHRNLVNMTGFCINNGRQTLVFEYLPHGSLHDRLHKSILGPSGQQYEDSLEMKQLIAKVLPWDTRVKIACDVAHGLEYLHHDADPPIVHRDVKAHNILLTETDSAKIADFGLSKAAPEQSPAFQSVETMVRGSFGYMDPQYFATGMVSTKCDVYSYGVVLLELITGHQAIHNATSLVFWAAPSLGHPSCYQNLVDEKLDGRFDQNQLEDLVELAKMCLTDDLKKRPGMRQVVAYLNSKNMVAYSNESIEQMRKSSDTVSWEEYHKTRKYSQADLESGSRSSEATMSQWQSMSMPDLLPRD